MEYLKEAKVTIEKDTNKTTVTEILTPYEYETMDEFIDRVTEKLREIYLEN